VALASDEPKTPGAPVATTSARPQALEESGSRTWYGWQILAVDATVVATWAGATALSGDVSTRDAGRVLAGVGLAGYLLDGPTLHVAHGQWPTAGLSLGGRVLLPGLGFLLGLAVGATQTATPTQEMPALADGGMGLLVGMAAASVIDIAVLPYEKVGAGAAPASAGGLRLQPTASAEMGAHPRACVGLAGVF
jgi:hypothetical protein